MYQYQSVLRFAIYATVFLDSWDNNSLQYLLKYSDIKAGCSIYIKLKILNSIGRSILTTFLLDLFEGVLLAISSDCFTAA